METKHQVHNLIILDESGSMGSIKKTIIQGFNEIVQTVKGVELNFPEQEHFISQCIGHYPYRWGRKRIKRVFGKGH